MTIGFPAMAGRFPAVAGRLPARACRIWFADAAR
jgi:hypothetical protein